MEAVVIIGTALAAYGQIRQGQIQSAQADYQSEIARQQAFAARQKAEFDEQAQREKAARLRGRQEAAYAKAGVDMSSGSPLEFLLQQTEEAEKEALAIRYSGMLGESRYSSQADYLSSTSGDYETAGMINATSTILQGIGKAMDYQANKKTTLTKRLEDTSYMGW